MARGFSSEFNFSNNLGLSQRCLIKDLKFIANVAVPLALRCNLLLPRQSKVIFSLQILFTLSCFKKFRTSFSLLLFITLSFRTVGWEKITLLSGKRSRINNFNLSKSSTISCASDRLALLVPQ